MEIPQVMKGDPRIVAVHRHNPDCIIARMACTSSDSCIVYYIHSHAFLQSSDLA